MNSIHPQVPAMTHPAPHPTGSCTLVGAGPGDPDLLTIAAAKAIQKATVLLVDDLVDDAILEWAQPGARVVHVPVRGYGAALGHGIASSRGRFVVMGARRDLVRSQWRVGAASRSVRLAHGSCACDCT